MLCHPFYVLNELHLLLMNISEYLWLPCMHLDHSRLREPKRIDTCVDKPTLVGSGVVPSIEFCPYVWGPLVTSLRQLATDSRCPLRPIVRWPSCACVGYFSLARLGGLGALGPHPFADVPIEVSHHQTLRVGELLSFAWESSCKSSSLNFRLHLRLSVRSGCFRSRSSSPCKSSLTELSACIFV